jgi:hypothetical protein
VRVDTERLSKEAAAQLILAQLEGRGFFSP